MKSLIFNFVLLFSSFSAFAEIQGDYLGLVDVSSGGHYTYWKRFRFENRDNSVYVSGSWGPSFALDWGQVFRKENGHIYSGDEAIGTYSDNEVNLTWKLYYYPGSERIQASLPADSSEGFLNFESETHYSISGIDYSATYKGKLYPVTTKEYAGLCKITWQNEEYTSPLGIRISEGNGMLLYVGNNDEEHFFTETGGELSGLDGEQGKITQNGFEFHAWGTSTVLHYTEGGAELTYTSGEGDGRFSRICKLSLAFLRLER